MFGLLAVFSFVNLSCGICVCVCVCESLCSHDFAWCSWQITTFKYWALPFYLEIVSLYGMHLARWPRSFQQYFVSASHLWWKHEGITGSLPPSYLLFFWGGDTSSVLFWSYFLKYRFNIFIQYIYFYHILSPPSIPPRSFPPPYPPMFCLCLSLSFFLSFL